MLRVSREQMRKPMRRCALISIQHPRPGAIIQSVVQGCVLSLPKLFGVHVAVCFPVVLRGYLVLDHLSLLLLVYRLRELDSQVKAVAILQLKTLT